MDLLFLAGVLGVAVYFTIAIVVPLLPAVVAAFKGRSFVGWYLYGLLLALAFSPLVLIPIIHSFFAARRVRRRRERENDVLDYIKRD